MFTPHSAVKLAAKVGCLYKFLAAPGPSTTTQINITSDVIISNVLNCKLIIVERHTLSPLFDTYRNFNYIRVAEHQIDVASPRFVYHCSSYHGDMTAAKAIIST